MHAEDSAEPSVWTGRLASWNTLAKLQTSQRLHFYMKLPSSDTPVSSVCGLQHGTHEPALNAYTEIVSCECPLAEGQRRRFYTSCRMNIALVLGHEQICEFLHWRLHTRPVAAAVRRIL
jgi:hypothetical protein